jgi:opacity protein-like surface antigen
VFRNLKETRMRSKPFLPLFLALILISFSGLAHSQVEASAFRNTLPFSAGAGVSGFNIDWGRNRMYAATVWLDWHPAIMPSVLRGLGVEGEGRDLNYGRSSTAPSNFRQDTILGGPIYTYPRFRNFRPYGKYLIGFGSFDFGNRGVNYTHDTRTLFEYGAGFDYRIWHHVYARAEYSYQDWGSLFNGQNRNPRGITVGAVYDFRFLRGR